VPASAGRLTRTLAIKYRPHAGRSTTYVGEFALRSYWRILALAILIGAVYLNERFNLKNQSLEEQLIGCWQGSSVTNGTQRKVLLEVRPNGTFYENTYFSMGTTQVTSSFSTSEGDWVLRKEEWILKHTKTTDSTLPIGPRGYYKFKVISVNSSELKVKDESMNLFHSYARQKPNAAKSCTVNA
jgi:hypothetical protein